MHYYQFNIGDYHSHTGYLSLLEDLAYRRLLDAYYLSESPFPDDPKQVARVIGMRDNVDEVTQILNDFFILKDGFWINKRVDSELELYHSKAVTARNNGKKGGRPTKAKETQGEPNPNPEITQSVNLANPELTGSKANHKPLTNNQEPIKTLDQNEFDQFFENFWASGIRKVNKKKAKSLFNNLLKKHNNPQAFTDALIHDVGKRLYQNQLGFAEMHPTTYLNGERWNDEVMPNEDSQKPINRKLSAVEEVRRAAERRARERESQAGSDGQAVVQDVGDIREGVHKPIRDRTNGELGEIIEGAFVRTDS